MKPEENIMPSEILSDFSAKWCQDLLHSPGLINISTTTRRPHPPADRIVTNTLFSSTFKTDTTIRAWQVLQAKHAHPPNISPAILLLLSLGSGLDGYRATLHGGMLSVIMDQATSMCAILTAGPGAVTAEMKLRYRKSVPLPCVVLCRTVATERQARKIRIRGTIEDGSGAMYCEAEVLCVTETRGKL